MSIATNYGHVYTAIQFLQNSNLYFELAHSDAWSDETSPDSESASATDLGTDLAYKQVDQTLLVYDGGATTETTDGSNYIIYGGHKWMTSSTADAYTNDAHYILLEATIPVSAFSDFTFRQIGVRNNVTFASNVTTSYALPANVTNKGSLLFYENKTARNYTSDSKTVIKYLIVF